MGQTRTRMERLLEDELGACCEADIEERVAELDELRAETSNTVRTDSNLLGTLSNETRLQLVRYLDTADRELCVCELETLADVSESAVSHALSDLLEVGLVTREKRGKWRYYEATERASAILATLEETRSGCERTDEADR